MNCLHEKIQSDTVLGIQFTMRRGIFFVMGKNQIYGFFFFFSADRLFFWFLEGKFVKKKKKQTIKGKIFFWIQYTSAPVESFVGLL